jgi:hypothetical protein
MTVKQVTSGRAVTTGYCRPTTESSFGSISGFHPGGRRRVLMMPAIANAGPCVIRRFVVHFILDESQGARNSFTTLFTLVPPTDAGGQRAAYRCSAAAPIRA